MELTPQQEQAVYWRKSSVVLSSGAGCGKTQVLTRRFLSHLELGETEVRQIVAITFTDRAAREMRDRIRKAVLDKLANSSGEADQTRWEKHHRDLENAQISTIHSFCANLLRQNAVEAGLDPNFDVLEENLAVNLENEALTRALQELLTAQSTAGKDLQELVVLFGWRQTVETIRLLIRNREPQLQHYWSGLATEDIAESWQNQARNSLFPEYVRYLTSANPAIARCLRLLRSTPCIGPKKAARVQTILEVFPQMAHAEDLSALLPQLKEVAKVNGTELADAWPSEEIYEQVKGSLSKFRQEISYRLALFAGIAENIPSAIQVGKCFLNVASEVNQGYQQAKHRHGFVDFADLLLLARDLLRDNSSIRRQLQRRFRFLLIDELQDTDPVQMEVVQYLAGDKLASGKLFAVGDHKQSIYRFRGADVQLFQDLGNQIPLEGCQDLTKNYRSQKAILDFVNVLSGPVKLANSESARNFLPNFQNLVSHHGQLNPHPCVEFLWAPVQEENAVESRSKEADWIARRIAAMLRKEECLVADRSKAQTHLRPVSAKDIVLLFRAMTHVEVYEEAFRKYGLDYYLVGGRAFFAQQEIFDLLNLLRTLENPQDAVSLVGTLRSPFCCVSDESLFVLSRNPEGIWEGLLDHSLEEQLPPHQRPRIERARGNLLSWRARKDQIPIALLLGEVFADSGYDAALQFESLGDRKLANLWKLVDLARNFDRSNWFGLAEFIERLHDLVQTQPREEQAATQPENADVIRMMSIHQAKGLEFPVVFIPDFASAVGGPRFSVAHLDRKLGCVCRPPNEKPLPFSDYGWRLWEAEETVANWQEELRTLYVACTRAKDYLIFSSGLSAAFQPENAWMFALEERLDLWTGRGKVADLPETELPAIRVYRQEEDLPLLSPLDRDTPPPMLYPGNTVPELFDKGVSPVSEPDDFQWDAEDGDDRNYWLFPLERQENIRLGPVERAALSVLAKWDIHGSTNWRDLLASETVRIAPVLSNSQQKEVIEMLPRFANSAVCRKMDQVKEIIRNIHFQIAVCGSQNTLFEDAPKIIRGVIDYLWQDNQGEWHLLKFVLTEGMSTPEQYCKSAVQWVQDHLQLQPASFTFYFLREGREERHEVKKHAVIPKGGRR